MDDEPIVSQVEIDARCPLGIKGGASMVKPIYGSKGKGASYNALRPIIKGWHKAMRRYSRIHRDEDDAGYYHNERANISLLAAGAWLSGNGALEEYGSDKYRSNKQAKGRVDLYLCKDNGQNAEIEAKIKWLKDHLDDTTYTNQIRAVLKRAVVDAKALQGSENRYACVFFISQFISSKFEDYKKRSDSLVRTHIDRTCQIENSAIWAWSFPSETRFTLDENIYYPGVIMGLISV
jgi:hypothetical protein